MRFDFENFVSMEIICGKFCKNKIPNVRIGSLMYEMDGFIYKSIPANINSFVIGVNVGKLALLIASRKEYNSALGAVCKIPGTCSWKRHVLLSALYPAPAASLMSGNLL